MEENIKSTETTPPVNIERKDLFKKIPLRYRFMRWWITTFRNKTLWKGDIGGFKFIVRKYWVDIRSIAKNEWNMRLGVNEHAHSYFVYLVTQMRQAEALGDTAQAEALKQHLSFFAVNMSLTSTFILSDNKFTSGLMREINWSVSRVMKKAAGEAKATTKEQNDTDEAFMQSAVERGQMNRKERRKAQRDERKAMKKAIKTDPVVRDMIIATGSLEEETETTKE